MNLRTKEIVMSDKNQPAFPVQDASTWQAHGISIRDYFAAKAMQGLMNTEYRLTDASYNAKQSYAIADAMLAAREAK
jgi:hypothetical protein